jgi:hypothetical protein
MQGTKHSDADGIARIRNAAARLLRVASDIRFH